MEANPYQAPLEVSGRRRKRSIACSPWFVLVVGIAACILGYVAFFHSPNLPMLVVELDRGETFSASQYWNILLLKLGGLFSLSIGVFTVFMAVILLLRRLRQYVVPSET
jgi:hypothetical protein